MRIAVLYGTETGTAQEVAERIAFEIASLGGSRYDVTLLPSDSTRISTWSPPPSSSSADGGGDGFGAIIFVVATAGNGDPPRTMRRTWRELLLRTCPRLDGLHYAVFGLGDNTYPRFNYMAKMLHNRLERLGATPLAHRGLGDDEDPQGYETELRPFLVELYGQLGLLALSDAEHDAAEAAAAAGRLPALPGALLRPCPEPLWRLGVVATARPGAVSDAAPRQATARREREDGCEVSDEPIAAGTAGAAAASSSPSLSSMNAEPPVKDQQAVDIATFLVKHAGVQPFHVVSSRRVTAANHFQDVRHLALIAADATKAQDADSSSGSGHHRRAPYLPGDTFAMYPRAPDAAVDAMLRCCGLDATDVVTITRNPACPVKSANNNSAAGPPPPPPSSSPPPPPCPPSPEATAAALVGVAFAARDLFSWVLDIQCNTPRQLLLHMSAWCGAGAPDAGADAAEVAERLQQLARESMDDYMEYVTRERRPVYETLEDFLPLLVDRPANWLDVVVSHLRPIAARHFSICKYDGDCAGADDTPSPPLSVELLVAIHRVTTPMKRQRRGLCGGYLEDFVSPHDPQQGTDESRSAAAAVVVLGFVERAVHTLPFPRDAAAAGPMLLVGPGTGIAPLRAVVQRVVANRGWWAAGGADGGGGVLVFTGHRHPDKDFPFRDEWQELQRAHGDVFLCHHSFSRPAPPTTPAAAAPGAATPADAPTYPKYVQHAMTRSPSVMGDVARVAAHPRGLVLVSGNAKQMPRDVHDGIVQCLVACGVDATEEAAAQRLDRMRQAGRYVVDAWA